MLRARFSVGYRSMRFATSLPTSTARCRSAIQGANGPNMPVFLRKRRSCWAKRNSWKNGYAVAEGPPPREFDCKDNANLGELMGCSPQIDVEVAGSRRVSGKSRGRCNALDIHRYGRRLMTPQGSAWRSRSLAGAADGGFVGDHKPPTFPTRSGRAPRTQNTVPHIVDCEEAVC